MQYSPVPTRQPPWHRDRIPLSRWREHLMRRSQQRTVQDRVNVSPQYAERTQLPSCRIAASKQSALHVSISNIWRLDLQTGSISFFCHSRYWFTEPIAITATELFYWLLSKSEPYSLNYHTIPPPISSLPSPPYPIWCGGEQLQKRQYKGEFHVYSLRRPGWNRVT